jgi:hypothetical protein
MGNLRFDRLMDSRLRGKDEGELCQACSNEYFYPQNSLNNQKEKGQENPPFSLRLK